MVLSRRGILTLAGLAALSLTIPACRRMLGQILFSPEAHVVSPPPPPRNPFRRDGRSVVALVHGREPQALVHRALDLLGGPDALGLRGRRVLVKPNVVSAARPPTTTDPRIVGAVVGWAREAGAGD